MNHDQIIDAAARQMTESDPPADLRARVIAALPTRTPHRWIRFAIPATAIGALAIIAMMSGALWLEGSKGPTVQGSRGPGVAATPQRVDSTAVATVGPAGPTPRRRSFPAEDFMFSSRAIAPLEEVTPLSITPIQPIGVSIAPITVTPIVTEPLVVPALDSRSGGRE